jgi:hypothetical protein
MYSACWISKPKNTQLEYAIIIAFRLQQWLQGRISLKQFLKILNYLTLVFYFTFYFLKL